MISYTSLQGQTLRVYGAGGRLLYSRPVSGALSVSNTSTTVTVRTRTMIYTYDEKGRQISVRPA